MPKFENPIYAIVTDSVKKALDNLASDALLSREEIYEALTVPPNLNLGHIAFPCFPLAKKLRKGPPMIAKELAAQVATGTHIERVSGEGPYLNFTISAQAFGETVVTACRNGEFFGQAQTDKPQKMMIEYSQPNTHKELHVGHMRNLCLGNALVNICRKSGFETISATYPGDVRINR